MEALTFGHKYQFFLYLIIGLLVIDGFGIRQTFRLEIKHFQKCTFASIIVTFARKHHVFTDLVHSYTVI